VKQSPVPVLALAILAVGGCSAGHDHPPAFEDTVPPEQAGFFNGSGSGGAPHDAGAHPPGDAAPASDGGVPADAAPDVVIPGMCPSNKTGLTSDIFDPHDVYFFVGGPTVDCLSNAAAGCTGLTTSLDPIQIRPTDGRIVYGTGTLAAFHADACGTVTLPNPGDTPVPTPGCTAVGDFKYSPEGDLYFRCDDTRGRYWYDASGTQLYKDTDGIWSIGHNKLAYTNGPIVGAGYATPMIVNLATGKTTSVMLPAFMGFDLLAIRAADPGGFWVIIRGANTGEGGATLWQIGPDGSVTDLGKYPPLPSGPISVLDVGYLDGCNRLVQVGVYPAIPPSNVSTDYLVRRAIGGASEKLYTDDMNPGIVMTGHLVSGP
jgi:hypothetical protein